MTIRLNAHFNVILRKAVTLCVLVCFLFTSILPVYAQSVFTLPIPGVRVSTSPSYNPASLRGLKVYLDNPFKFDFIVDAGDSKMEGEALKAESTRLIKYFLASLTTPEEDMWVNLSPYEKDRIVPESFGTTEMGRDLLAQDYLLKQITASIIYPEEELGKKFWEKVYSEAQKKFGTTDIPVNTFNKVWVVPDKVVVYEHDETALVVKARLKVMLEEDYLALANNTKDEGRETKDDSEVGSSHVLVSRPSSDVLRNEDVNKLGSQIIREIVIPELEREVNEGKNFAQLRQVYQSLILATWYKKKLKDSILAKVYIDKKKTAGIEITRDEGRKTKDENDGRLTSSSLVPVSEANDRPTSNVTPEDIYQQYLAAFKKGVYNYIKEDYDAATQEVIPRKYFSGGFGFDRNRMKLATRETSDPSDPAVMDFAEQQQKTPSPKYLVSEETSVINGAGKTLAPRTANTSSRNPKDGAMLSMTADKARSIVYDSLKRSGRAPASIDAIASDQIEIRIGVENAVIFHGNSAYRYRKVPGEEPHSEIRGFQIMGEKGLSPRVKNKGFFVGDNINSNYVFEVDRIFGRSVEELETGGPLNDVNFSLLQNLIDQFVENAFFAADWHPGNVVIGKINPEDVQEQEQAYLVDLPEFRRIVNLSNFAKRDSAESLKEQIKHYVETNPNNKWSPQTSQKIIEHLEGLIKHYSQSTRNGSQDDSNENSVQDFAMLTATGSFELSDVLPMQLDNGLSDVPLQGAKEMLEYALKEMMTNARQAGQADPIVTATEDDDSIIVTIQNARGAIDVDGLRAELLELAGQGRIKQTTQSKITFVANEDGTVSRAIKKNAEDFLVRLIPNNRERSEEFRNAQVMSVDQVTRLNNEDLLKVFGLGRLGQGKNVFNSGIGLPTVFLDAEAGGYEVKVKSYDPATFEVRIQKDRAMLSSDALLNQLGRLGYQRSWGQIVDQGWYSEAYETTSLLYHKFFHTLRTAGLAYQSSRSRKVDESFGFANDELSRLEELAGLLHDFHPGRPFGTPPKVPDTLKRLGQDWNNETSLSGQSGQSELRDILKGNDLLFLVLKAFVQRTEFPFVNQGHPNADYKDSSPVARYQEIIEDIRKADTTPEQSYLRFVVQEAPIFAEYSDKLGLYLSSDFPAVVQEIEELAVENGNNHAPEFLSNPQTLVANTRPGFLAKMVGVAANFRFDREIAAAMGITDIHFPDKEEFLGTVPEELKRNHQAILKGLEAIEQALARDPQNFQAAKEQGFKAARADGAMLGEYLRTQGNPEPMIQRFERFVAKDDGQTNPAVLFLASGGTDLETEVARRNRGLNVTASDIYKSKLGYVDDISFENGRLAAQKAVEAGQENLSLLKADGERLLADWSYGPLEKLVLVNPDDGIMTKVLDMIADGSFGRVLKKGGQVIILPQSEGYEKILLDHPAAAQMKTDSNRTIYGVDINAFSTYQSEMPLYVWENTAEASVDKGLDSEVGGIDFNPNKIDLEVNNDGGNFEFTFDPAQIENMQIDGLVPVIINITPVKDLPMLIGIKKEDQLQQLTMK